MERTFDELVRSDVERFQEKIGPRPGADLQMILLKAHLLIEEELQAFMSETDAKKPVVRLSATIDIQSERHGLLRFRRWTPKDSAAIDRTARPNLKASAFPLLQESQVVIDVRELTMDERERILYNHLKFGDQPRRFRAAVKPYLPGVAAHKRFAPEIARRLAHPLFTRNLELNKAGLADFVRRREHLLKEVIEGLDSHSRAGLALIYMGGGELPSPIILDDRRADALARLDSDLGKCTAAAGAR